MSFHFDYRRKSMKFHAPYLAFCRRWAESFPFQLRVEAESHPFAPLLSSLKTWSSCGSTFSYRKRCSSDVIDFHESSSRLIKALLARQCEQAMKIQLKLEATSEAPSAAKWSPTEGKSSLSSSMGGEQVKVQTSLRCCFRSALIALLIVALSCVCLNRKT